MDAVQVAVLFSLYPQQIKRPPQNSRNAKPALRPAAQGLMVTKASDVMEGTFLPPTPARVARNLEPVSNAQTWPREGSDEKESREEFF